LNPALQTAYRYGDPDRSLNVVVLSDGLTDAGERTELTRLIASRPSHARVFCIGVGNEVNRPLLEQVAQDTGGLAAFISKGDNFNRQASAFRRKLMRPAVSNLRVSIDGVDVYDLEPPILPNLYHGAPVHMYGRYKGQGAGSVRLEGNVRGADFSQTVDLEFPSIDNDHPEIERMWAWKRMDRLLKEADKAGNRDPVVNEIVRLGELYSIVSEYTSFIVLENDAEYQRWKINRLNARRIDRDRAALARVQNDLRSIRDQAVAGLGPNPAPEVAKQTTSLPWVKPASASTPSAPVQVAQPPRPRQSRDFSFGGGSGPVGPLFLGIAALMQRMRRKRSSH
jgi:Ca-activated chloride channel family protein